MMNNKDILNEIDKWLYVLGCEKERLEGIHGYTWYVNFRNVKRYFSLLKDDINNE